MDFDDVWAEPTEKLENKEKKELPLHSPQGVHPSSPKNLSSLEQIQSLPLIASLLPEPEFVSTSPATNIKPPPLIFTDPWGDSGDSYSELDKASPTSMLKSNQKIEKHQYTLISEETNEIELFSKIDNTQEDDPFTLNDISENWTEHATNSLDDLTLFKDLNLFDIDAVLEKQEEAAQFQEHKRKIGTSTWRQRLERWGGIYSLTHVNWANKETARWEVLEHLGYTHTPLSKETRDYIIQAARNAKLAHWQKVQLTTQLANAHAQLAFFPPLNTKELEDLYETRRKELHAEIAVIEQTLANDVQWIAIKRAVQFLGQGIELDDLMMRDNYLVRW